MLLLLNRMTWTFIAGLDRFFLFLVKKEKDWLKYWLKYMHASHAYISACHLFFFIEISKEAKSKSRFREGSSRGFFIHLKNQPQHFVLQAYHLKKKKKKLEWCSLLVFVIKIEKKNERAKYKREKVLLWLEAKMFCGGSTSFDRCLIYFWKTQGPFLNIASVFRWGYRMYWLFFCERAQPCFHVKAHSQLHT